MIDWRGNEFDVGDKIVYPGQHGSHSAHMVEAVVMEFVPPSNRSRTWRVKVLPIRNTAYGQTNKVVILSKVKNITLIEKGRTETAGQMSMEDK